MNLLVVTDNCIRILQVIGQSSLCYNSCKKYEGQKKAEMYVV